MARIARVEAPGTPHHITQRGNRRQETFFCAEDYQAFIEQNPVRAGLAGTPWEYPWSSAAAHVARRDDVLSTVAPLLALVSDWKGFLCAEAPADDVRQLRRHERTGRPLGTEQFITDVERTLHRTLRRRTPGPKRSGDS
jgi:putative transposase